MSNNNESIANPQVIDHIPSPSSFLFLMIHSK